MSLHAVYIGMTYDQMHTALEILVRKTSEWNELAMRRKEENGSVPSHIRAEILLLTRKKAAWADVYFIKFLRKREGDSAK